MCRSAVARGRVFAVALCRACRSVISRPMLLPRSLWTFWFRCCRAATFCGEDVDRASIFWSVYSRPTRRWSNSFVRLLGTPRHVPVSLGVRLLMCRRVAFVCRPCIVHNRDRFVHARTLSDVGSSMAVGSLELLKLCSWFVSAESCHHATHDGLKCPLKDEIGNDQMMRNMWAKRLSYRSTTASLAENRERWIASRLVFCEWTFDGQLPCLDIDCR